MSKKRFSIYGIVTGSKYLGEVEAETADDAVLDAWETLDTSVSVCHHCAKDISDPEIHEIQAYEITED